MAVALQASHCPTCYAEGRSHGPSKARGAVNGGPCKAETATSFQQRNAATPAGKAAGSLSPPDEGALGKADLAPAACRKRSPHSPPVSSYPNNESF